MSPRRCIAVVLLVGSPVFASDPGATVEVRFVSGGTLPVRLRVQKLELTTKYGPLVFPIGEVRKVEVATRTTPDAADRIAAAVGRLGDPDFRTRTRAEAELRDYQVRAYPLLLKAAKLPDPETARRADALVQVIRRQVPLDDLTIREFDVVHTDDGTFVGTLTADSFRVGTGPFGDQTLKLADVREVRQPAGPGFAAAAAIPAPPTLMEYQGRFGTEMDLIVTGAVSGPPAAPVPLPPPGGVPPGLVIPLPAGPAAASVWGTDVYTIDSSVAAAAVHAGAVKPGQSVTVRVRILLSPPSFVGTARNGIASQSYNVYPPGAFEFVRP